MDRLEEEQKIAMTVLCHLEHLTYGPGPLKIDPLLIVATASLSQFLGTRYPEDLIGLDGSHACCTVEFGDRVKPSQAEFP